MRLSDFEHDHNQFVAMEYHALIWNRTLLVLLTDSHLIGVVAAGALVARPGMARALGPSVANPNWYVDKRYLRKVQNLDLLGDEFLRQNRGNFCVPYIEIGTASYDPRKKWGMSGFPHDGRVNVSMHERNREFIVLGDQSGEAIARKIVERISLAKQA